MFELYGDIFSGNCYKVKLLMNLLDIEHRWIHVDILKGESRVGTFLDKNPNGKIPLLITDDGRTLCESNAILHYLAADTQFVPKQDFEFAQVLQWQFFEQYSHEPYIATSRYIVRYLNSPPARRAELESKRSRGYAALKIMDDHLKGRDYFVGGSYTLADISLYAYTHVAHEGGFSLTEFSNIRHWFGCLETQSRHQSMAELAG